VTLPLWHIDAVAGWGRPSHCFARLSNVVLTAHLAGGARSGVVRELAIVLRNCHAALRGEPPEFAVL
jgi:phosphoglycerate dehydrogenase-like enzyme